MHNTQWVLKRVPAPYVLASERFEEFVERGEIDYYVPMYERAIRGSTAVLTRLEEIREYQENDIARYLEEIEDVCVRAGVSQSPTLREIYDAVLSGRFRDGMTLWRIEHVFKLLSGEDFDFDSGFYDEETGYCRVTDDVMERVRKEPNNYYLVPFDTHC